VPRPDPGRHLLPLDVPPLDRRLVFEPHERVVLDLGPLERTAPLAVGALRLAIPHGDVVSARVVVGGCCCGRRRGGGAESGRRRAAAVGDEGRPVERDVRVGRGGARVGAKVGVGRGGEGEEAAVGRRVGWWGRLRQTCDEPRQLRVDERRARVVERGRRRWEVRDRVVEGRRAERLRGVREERVCGRQACLSVFAGRVHEGPGRKHAPRANKAGSSWESSANAPCGCGSTPEPCAPLEGSPKTCRGSCGASCAAALLFLGRFEPAAAGRARGVVVRGRFSGGAGCSTTRSGSQGLVAIVQLGLARRACERAEMRRAPTARTKNWAKSEFRLASHTLSLSLQHSLQLANSLCVQLRDFETRCEIQIKRRQTRGRGRGS